MSPTPADSQGSKPLPKWLQVRMAASALLRGRRGTGNVTMLPFNKVVKSNVQPNEIAALEYVAANTTIPVPKVLKIYDRQPDGSATIVMTQMPGVDLWVALRSMTPGQVTSAARQVAGYLAQLRQLAPQQSVIGGTIPGTQGADDRLGSYPWGPFQNIADFHTYVRLGQPLADWSHQPAVMEVHGKPEGAYKLQFCHADLAPRNILADPKTGKITAIVDWEFGGWYPEYWEYTKMYYGGVPPVCEPWFAAIEKEDGIQKYPTEWKAEEAVWIKAGVFGYEMVDSD